MHKLIVGRLLIARISILSILLASLLPMIACAVSTGERLVDKVEVCTAQGMVTLAVEKANSNTPDPTPLRTTKRCPYCAVHADGLGLIPTSELNLVTSSQNAFYFRFSYQSAMPLFPWTAATPRAPPVLDDSFDARAAALIIRANPAISA